MGLADAFGRGHQPALPDAVQATARCVQRAAVPAARRALSGVGARARAVARVAAARPQAPSRAARRDRCPLHRLVLSAEGAADALPRLLLARDAAAAALAPPARARLPAAQLGLPGRG